MKRNLSLFAALLLLVAGGCATAPFEVSDSQLNWLLVTYAPQGGKACRVNLIGAGYIDFIEGASPLVTDDFSMKVESELWQDKQQERLGLSPGEIRTWIQRFADAGLARRHKSPSRQNVEKGHVVFIRASVNREKYGFVTDDERLISLVDDLVRSIKVNGGRP